MKSIQRTSIWICSAARKRLFTLIYKQQPSNQATLLIGPSEAPKPAIQPQSTRYSQCFKTNRYLTCYITQLDRALYLVTNDLSIDTDLIYEVYPKRWGIEDYQKSIKKKCTYPNNQPKRFRPQPLLQLSATPEFLKMEDGREFSAWLGLVPRQHSSGNKITYTRLLKGKLKLIANR